MSQLTIKKYIASADTSLVFSKTEESTLFCEFIFCACGCGKTRSKYDSYGILRKYIDGHQRFGKFKHSRKEMIQCSCGCGRSRTKYDKRGRLRQFLNNHSKRVDMKGWYIDKHGYKRLQILYHRLANSRGEVLEHRYLFELYHKCSLLKWSHVHHDDEDPLNNSKSNLIGMTKRQHIRYHAKKRWQRRKNI